MGRKALLVLVVFIINNWNSKYNNRTGNLLLTKFFYGICSLMGERMVVDRLENLNQGKSYRIQHRGFSLTRNPTRDEYIKVSFVKLLGKTSPKLASRDYRETTSRSRETRVRFPPYALWRITWES